MTKLIDLIGTVLPADTVIGVRVKALCTDAHGIDKIVTVLINTNGEADAGYVLDAAVSYLAQGNHPHAGTDTVTCDASVAGIAAIFVGGFDQPTINLPVPT
jgi:hypothetical protein